MSTSLFLWQTQFWLQIFIVSSHWPFVFLLLYFFMTSMYKRLLWICSSLSDSLHSAYNLLDLSTYQLIEKIYMLLQHSLSLSLPLTSRLFHWSLSSSFLSFSRQVVHLNVNFIIVLSNSSHRKLKMWKIVPKLLWNANENALWNDI